MYIRQRSYTCTRTYVHMTPRSRRWNGGKDIHSKLYSDAPLMPDGEREGTQNNGDYSLANTHLTSLRDHKWQVPVPDPEEISPRVNQLPFSKQVTPLRVPARKRT